MFTALKDDSYQHRRLENAAWRLHAMQRSGRSPGFDAWGVWGGPEVGVGRHGMENHGKICSKCSKYWQMMLNSSSTKELKKARFLRYSVKMFKTKQSVSIGGALPFLNCWHTQEAASRVTGGKCAFKKGLQGYIWAISINKSQYGSCKHLNIVSSSFLGRYY